MQTSQILSAPLIDIIFDGRNKDYGAYELRKTYSKRIGKALLLTGIILFITVGATALTHSSKKITVKYRNSDTIVIADIIPPVEKQPEPEPMRQQEQVRTEIYTAPVIENDEEVETPPPTQDELSTAVIADERQDGIDDNGISDPGPQNIDKGTHIIDQPAASDEIQTFVEIDAKYPGNWKAFLERNLNAEVPLDNNAPPGSYSVVIQFVVDREGNVSDITPQTNHGYGMEAEAVRVLKKATKWEPAIQNGIKVKAYRRQVIVFQVIEE